MLVATSVLEGVIVDLGSSDGASNSDVLVTLEEEERGIAKTVDAKTKDRRRDHCCMVECKSRCNREGRVKVVEKPAGVLDISLPSFDTLLSSVRCAVRIRYSKPLGQDLYDTPRNGAIGALEQYCGEVQYTDLKVFRIPEFFSVIKRSVSSQEYPPIVCRLCRPFLMGVNTDQRELCVYRVHIHFFVSILKMEGWGKGECGPRR